MKIILKITIINIIIYLLFSFVSLELNPFIWDEETRIVYSVMIPFLSFLYLLILPIIEMSKEIQKKINRRDKSCISETSTGRTNKFQDKMKAKMDESRKEQQDRKENG